MIGCSIISVVWSTCVNILHPLGGGRRGAMNCMDRLSYNVKACGTCCLPDPATVAVRYRY